MSNKYNKIISDFYDSFSNKFRGKIISLSEEELLELVKEVEKNYPTDKYLILHEVANIRLEMKHWNE